MRAYGYGRLHVHCLTKPASSQAARSITSSVHQKQLAASVRSAVSADSASLAAQDVQLVNTSSSSAADSESEPVHKAQQYADLLEQVFREYQPATTANGASGIARISAALATDPANLGACHTLLHSFIADPDKCHKILQQGFAWRRDNGAVALKVPPAEALHERVEYLKQVGLSHEALADVVGRFPGILGFDSRSMSRVVMFLKSLGLSSADILVLLRREPRVLCYNVTATLAPACAFYRSLGIKGASLIRLLVRRPAVFGLGVEKQLRPRVAFLTAALGFQRARLPEAIVQCPALLYLRQERLLDTLRTLRRNGLSDKTIAKVVARFPPVFALAPQRLQATFHFLLSLGIPPAALDTVAYRQPSVFTGDCEQGLPATVAWFEAQGVPRQRLAKSIAKFPSLLSFSIQGKLSQTVELLTGYGLTKQNIAHVLATFPQILGLSIEENLHPSLQYLQSIGIQEADLVQVLSRMPQILGLQVGQLKLKHAFLCEEMGGSVRDIISFPPFFGCSLEARIGPRYTLSALHHKSYSLSTMLATSDAVFCRRLGAQEDELVLLKASWRDVPATVDCRAAVTLPELTGEDISAFSDVDR